MVILIGGFTLSPRSLVLLLLVVAGELAWLIGHDGLRAVRQGNLLVVAVTAIVVLLVARSRARLGVQGLRGESMLVDLRDRLRAQGELPELPPDWSTDVVLRPAGGASFSGDFLVAGAGIDERMEIVLVDVSGKGVDAGTRALLLSGAFGGLLGATPSEEFLGAANAYLVRQGWDEGFATAVHVAIDLPTGDFLVASAGHPPAAHFTAGSGTWQLLDVPGTALGIDPAATYGMSKRQPRSRRRAAALHRRSGRAARVATSPSASTGCWARRSGWCRAGSVAGRAGCSTRCAPARATTAPSS